MAWFYSEFCLCLLLFSFPISLSDPALPENQTEAVKGLISRLLGEDYVEKFDLQIISATSQGRDVFEIDSSGNADQVTIRGNTGVAMASGFNWYLKYYCNCHVSWGVNGTGDQLNVPTPLPRVTQKVRIESPVKYRYYMNVCTVSYSMVWWDWQRWQREIDWMALQGINLPLSFTGQELIWAETFIQLGLSEAELEEYFSGPAFLAWNRMGNMRGWGGPLSKSWRSKQANLQKQILQQQRQFGMTSVLPGFSGHVPKELQKIFPHANLSRSPDWGRFNDTYCCVYLLSPADPEFSVIAKKFIEVLMENFGTDHVYNVDTFNEMNPASKDPTYLAATSSAVLKGLQSADPDAVWLMQGWLFLSGFWGADEMKAYLNVIPNNKMIILDLDTENRPIWKKSDSYYGKPFVWCMLHNFGGTRGLYGNLTRIATGPLADRAAPGSTMDGVGITMEAIEHNPIVYELMLEMGWRSSPFDLDEWVRQYAVRRYGTKNDALLAAWHILQTTLYTIPSTSKSQVEVRPSITIGKNYSPNTTALVQAWRLFVQGALEIKPVGPFRYDLVDVTRQALLNLFTDFHSMFMVAYQRYQLYHVNSSVEFNSIVSVMLEIIDDLDQLLGSDVNFLLGIWTTTARSWGDTEEEKNLMELNARNQVTLWGPRGNIEDYASKNGWSGLVGDYYLSRWHLFVSRLQGSIHDGTAMDFNAYESDLLQLEQKWSYTVKPFSIIPVGETVSIAKSLVTKWGKSSTQGYDVVPETDASGHDLLWGTQMWTRDVEQLKLLCNSDALCAGFNTNGYLKNMTASAVRVHSPNTDLYVKIM
ncbi:alpha-N-acetylglucosaminidase-like isoform X2 [Corticium candelabrum]|uniref:alpha-N-acetylglucosaminidase-like isoform X2 n=1 Tax=Corticium candelabrum TaxID=121492 RepID=UPI002E274AB3|nr:alpha-N-acetylglucosaminidase-like isoform X2 [Corticium candelabrum]